jgi:hypothetical protein
MAKPGLAHDNKKAGDTAAGFLNCMFPLKGQLPMYSFNTLL